jgi:hypothetical protein
LLAGTATSVVEFDVDVPTLAESASGAANNDRLPVATNSGAAD